MSGMLSAAQEVVRSWNPTRPAGRDGRAPLAFLSSEKLAADARGWTRIVGPVLVGTIAVGIFCMPRLGMVLEFSRSAILQGEWWRTLTGHLTHFTGQHVLWDTLAMVVLGVVVAERSVGRFWWTLVGGAVAISLAVLAWLPGVEVYRGLSGVDSAMFACAAALVMRKERGTMAWVAGLAILGFLGKTVFELWTGRVIFVQDLGGGVSPVVLAHLIGAAWGVVVGMWEFRHGQWLDWDWAVAGE